MAKMSHTVRFARVNLDLCRIYMTKVHVIGVGNVTVFTGLLAFIKEVGCDKHPLPFARPAKQTKIH